MIIDGTDLIVGRVGTVVAKRALLGDQIQIVNAEKMVLTGSRVHLHARYRRKLKLGTPAKGPFISRRPDRFVRRMIRGMIPYKTPRGASAFKRIMCYIGAPEEIRGKKETIKEANISELDNLRYMRVGDLCKLLGSHYE